MYQYSVDFTVGTLLSLMDRGKIKFEPPPSTDEFDSYALLDSVVRDLPIGLFVLAEHQHTGEYVVVDGRKRLHALNLLLRRRADVDNYPCRIAVLREWTRDQLKEVFLRSNSHSNRSADDLTFVWIETDTRCPHGAK